MRMHIRRRVFISRETLDAAIFWDCSIVETLGNIFTHSIRIGGPTPDPGRQALEIARYRAVNYGVREHVAMDLRLDRDNLRIEILAESDLEHRLAAPMVEYGRVVLVPLGTVDAIHMRTGRLKMAISTNTKGISWRNRPNVFFSLDPVCPHPYQPRRRDVYAGRVLRPGASSRDSGAIR